MFIARSSPPGLCNVNKLAGNLFLKKTSPYSAYCVPRNWLWSGFIFPRIRTFVEKRFHGLISKKKRSKSGGVPSFPRREHVLAVISIPSGQQTYLDPITKLLHYLESRDIFCPRKLLWAKIPLPKNLSRKIARFFVSQIRPATGVNHDLPSRFCCSWCWTLSTTTRILVQKHFLI